LDSGSMPYAQYHYPFENKDQFDKNYPADFICEGIDQTRGWFYSLLAISTLLFDKPPFKSIVVNELILDRNGQKMSKSRGNAVVPEHIISKYGADTLRWYLLTTSPPWTPKRFDEEGIKEVLRKFVNTLLNTYSFFVLYANIDDYTGKESEFAFHDRQEIDRWILSKLYSVVDQVNGYLDAYELTKAARLINDYVVDDVSNWYIRRNRRRFWKGEDSNDKLSAYQTLHEVLMTIARLIAPFTPFLADDIYTNLKKDDDPESVHLDLYPVFGDKEKSLCDTELENRMAIAQSVASISHSLRNDSNVRVRQPLSRVIVSVNDKTEAESLKKMSGIICEELNVKNLELVDSPDNLVQKSVKPNFKLLGPKVGKLMGKIAPVIEAFGDDQIKNLEQTGFERINIDGQEFKIQIDEINIQTSSKEGLAVYSDSDITVAIDLELTDELIDEGLARELINRIQNLRKDSGLAVTDRIDIYFENVPDRVSKAIHNKSEYISNETLVVNLLDENDDNLITKEISIAEDSFLIGLKKTK